MFSLFKSKKNPISLVFRMENEQFTINEQVISFPVALNELEKIVSKPNRKSKKKYNTIYTWDNLGILGYSKNGTLLENLTLELTHSDFDFSPKQIFTGEFIFKGEDIIAYYKNHKDERVRTSKYDANGALVMNDIQVYFSVRDREVKALQIGVFEGAYTVPKDKYLIKKLDEDTIEFSDFGFKLAIIEELMYQKGVLKPKFDLHEFVAWYDKRDIDLEKEGYDPIPEVTQYFKDLPIPKRFASEITEIYQDGGNNIYMQLIRFGEGYEDYWDIETVKDTVHFPNLKKAVLCYAKSNVLEDLLKQGIEARWL